MELAPNERDHPARDIILLILLAPILLIAIPIFIIEELVGAYAETGMPTKEEWRYGLSRYKM